MMISIRIVAGLHLLVYLGIMWYGWQSYKMFRKPSWKVMGVGFSIFLIYRIREFVRQLFADYLINTESTLVPFVGSVLLLVAFRMLRQENKHVVELMKRIPQPQMSGALPAKFWLENFREIVREEIGAALGALKLKTTTTTTPAD